MDNVLFNKNKTSLIWCTRTKQGAFTIPNSVTYIGSSAFSGCSGLTSITIPNSVTSIGNYAFRFCSGLTSITIPNSVTSIGEYAFYDCSNLNSIKVQNPVTSFSQYAFSNTGWYNSQPEGLLYLDNLLLGYKGAKPTENVEIKDGTRAIVNLAFNACNNITSVAIPNSVSSIGRSAFADCSGLTSITIPNSVTSIGRYAFADCSGLTSITIPNSVTDISYAFSGCTSLTSVNIPNSVTDIAGTFSGCTSLTSVNIPNSVTRIGDDAFRYCSGLTSITIPNSVTSIGVDAFFDCSALSSVTIPNSMTSIGECAFRNCVGLTSVTIPNSVTSIEDRAFVGCSGLTSVTIPKFVTSIGSYALYISSLKEVYCYAESVSTGAYAVFSDADIKSATLHVPAASLETYKSTAPWNEFGTIVAFHTSRPTSGNYMYVDKLTVKPGKTVQIPVELVLEEQYDEEIVGFQCNIKLPEGFDFVKNSKGNAVITLNQDRIDGHSILSKIKDDGSINIACSSMNLGGFTDLDGEIMYVSVIANKGLADGEYAMQISNVRLSTDEEEITCPEIIQTFEVKNFMLGDLNDDGEWTILDVTLAIKHVLEETYTDAADMNEDGVITILDVTKVIQYVLNEGPIETASAPAAKQMTKVAAKDSQKLYAENLCIEPGTEQTLTVKAHLNNEDYVGCQLEMQLPEGFCYVTSKQGNVIVTPNADCFGNHTVTTKLLDNGRTLRVVLTSLDLDHIICDGVGDDVLFSVKIKADESVEVGNHEIGITNILFSTEGNQDCIIGVGGNIQVLCEDESNTINSAINMKEPSKIYTLDGKHVNAIEKGGIYIVDGVKVIMK